MIGYLKGQVKAKYNDGVLIDVNGVGYEVAVPEGLKLEGEVELYIYTVVREDALDLYGFPTAEEKDFFVRLRSVHGIGPKSALALMAFSITELKEAIIDEDVKKLTSAHGVGKKGAERLILEMKNKLPDVIGDDRKHAGLSDDVFNALENLGYRKKDIQNVIKDMPQELKETEQVVKYFLQHV